MRTHEKALANALQLRRQSPKNGQQVGQNRETPSTHIGTYQSSAPTISTPTSFAAALSLGTLNFASQNMKSAKLTLTPHHLFYLLSRFEEIGISIGPMNVRLENIHADASPANYVSFLSQSQRSKGRSDRDSIHSVSSVRSVISGMSALWSNMGLNSSNNAAKSEKNKAQMLADLKYLYSAFTKIPCLRLSPDRKVRAIGGYEEFPFDTAVPLLAFKNMSALEICDVDFRQFFGWDRLAEQLRSLTVKRGNVEDPTDLLTGIVLDDMDKRRRRSSKAQSSPILSWPLSPSARYGELGRFSSTPGSPVVDDKLAQSTSPQRTHLLHGEAEGMSSEQRHRNKSISPSRPTSSKQENAFRYPRGSSTKIKRSGSGSSNSSSHSVGQYRTGSSSNLLTTAILPASKWRFLRHLSLADNSLTAMTHFSLSPLANTLYSLDLSSNLFTEIPDNLATLTALRALNLSNCMIESLHSLSRNPLPAITALNLRANRLGSIAGVERLLSLERLDLRENRIQDPMEAARLTGIPDIREIWITGNPLVKSHSNYRVIIFNLFRSTPGFVEDIMLDASGPGYSERRQLKERVSEPESVPVVNPAPVFDTDTSINVRSPALKADDFAEQQTSEGLQRPAPQTTQSEIATSSSRRKKGPKRRIVDLSREDIHYTLHHEAPSIESPSSTFPAPGDGSQNSNSPKETPGLFPSRGLVGLPSSRPANLTSSISSPLVRGTPEPSNHGLLLANDLQKLNFNGEAYRQKVEALKSEVGNNWLSVLSEEGWNDHNKVKVSAPDYGRIDVLRPDLSSLQSSSQRILSSSRTLG